MRALSFFPRETAWSMLPEAVGNVVDSEFKNLRSSTASSMYWPRVSERMKAIDGTDDMSSTLYQKSQSTLDAVKSVEVA